MASDYLPLGRVPRGTRIEAWCGKCQWGSPVDTESWARKYGRDKTLVDLEPRLKCAVCGGRGRFRVPE